VGQAGRDLLWGWEEDFPPLGTESGPEPAPRVCALLATPAAQTPEPTVRGLGIGLYILGIPTDKFGEKDIAVPPQAMPPRAESRVYAAARVQARAVPEVRAPWRWAPSPDYGAGGR
jgi:hypothetical protein